MSDHFEIVIPRLERLSETLDEQFGDAHHFTRASGQQSDQAFEAVAKKGDLSPTNFVATMVGNSHHVRQFELSLFLSSVVIRRTIRMAVFSAQADDLLGFLWMLRTLIERFAHVSFLIGMVEKKLANENALDENASYVAMLAIDEVSKQALYGTLVHWNRVATKSLQEIDLSSDLGRNARAELGVHAAKQVLDKIDFLEKSVKGTRAAYEILCEFLHPNVGDLFACTTKYTRTQDRNRVVYIERDVSLTGSNTEAVRTVEHIVMSRICKHLLVLCDHYETNLQVGRDLSAKMVTKLKSATRHIVRKNRNFFKRNDRCPCASGAVAFECCGKGLMLDP